MKKKFILTAVFATVLSLASCGSNYKYVQGKVNIVATTTMLGDLAHQIGGDKVSVKTLMSVGVDPHLYSAKASDTNALSKSDFIIFGGLHLEGKMVDILELLSKEKPYLNSGETLLEKDGVLLLDDDLNTDPHVWFNVENWIIIAQDLARKLITYDVANASYYQERSDQYVATLQNLHAWIQTRVLELTPNQRVLVTAHDAFQYFADAYGFEVESIQGISTESEASIGDIRRLVDLVIAKQVKAIFVESSVPQKTIDSVIAAARNRTPKYTLAIGGELYSDSLGDGDDSTYVNAVKTNVNRIVDSLK